MRGIVAFVSLTLCAGIASAQYLPATPYLSTADSPFAGITFNYFHLENFEDGALNTPGLSASNGGPIGPGATTDSVDGDDGAIDGSGVAGHSFYAQQTAITFSFSAAALGVLPTHAGVVFTDVGNTITDIGFANVYFEAFDASGVSLGVQPPLFLGDGSVLGGTAEDRFFGVINLGGISAIRISIPNSVDWEVDHVQYGAVPAPGAAALVSLAAASALRRRR